MLLCSLKLLDGRSLLCWRPKRQWWWRWRIDCYSPRYRWVTLVGSGLLHLGVGFLELLEVAAVLQEVA